MDSFESALEEGAFFPGSHLLVSSAPPLTSGLYYNYISQASLARPWFGQAYLFLLYIIFLDLRLSWGQEPTTTSEPTALLVR